MRVLVVEDEARMADGRRRGLEAEGFAVDVATDGTDGLWMAREHPYDAILLDIMLPGTNGYQVCAALWGDGNWTPIVMLTAKDGDLDEAEALDTGADDYVTKPFLHRSPGPAAGAATAGSRRAPGGARGRRPPPRPGARARPGEVRRRSG